MASPALNELNIQGSHPCIKIFVMHLNVKKISKIINPLMPGDAYMCLWFGSLLVQLMAWHLPDAKPSPESTLTYSQLDPRQHTSMKFESKYEKYSFKKFFLKMYQWNLNQIRKIFFHENVLKKLLWSWPLIIQVIASCLVSTKPLPNKPTITYCHMSEE